LPIILRLTVQGKYLYQTHPDKYLPAHRHMK